MTYSPDLTRAVRHALYRLRWKLGRAWGNRVVLVGGLAPPFLVPEPASGVEPHVGTADIDLAIGLFAPEEEAYVSLVRALKDCGFGQRQPEEPSGGSGAKAELKSFWKSSVLKVRRSNDASAERSRSMEGATSLRFRSVESNSRLRTSSQSCSTRRQSIWVTEGPSSCGS